ncbi:MAG TPA: DUF4920 domain-containing protein [Polyangiaceae bacterium]|nr:DUF4920 domain-containing protein [Polyangiaceae bacterium]
MLPAPLRFGVFLSLAALAGCETRTPAGGVTPAPSSAPPASSAATRASAKAFGSPISAGPELALSDVLASPERFRDRAIIVQGQVRSACTRRGCWMEMAEGADPQLPGCRVTFKDYGFFVPTDAAGARATVQGTLGVNTLPPERVAHLESEGGQFPRKNADGSVDELRLVATGVELRRQ